VDEMEGEAKQIRSEALKMCWYMRGGLTYNESMSLGPTERSLISDIIKENLETTKKSGLPFY
jgi:hypothetical protein